MDRRCGRSTCTKRSFFRPQRRSKKKLFPSPTVVDGRRPQNTLVFNRRSQRGEMSPRNRFFWTCYGRFKLRILAPFLRTTLDASAGQNPTDEQRLDALAGQDPTCRLYRGPLWTTWPVTIPQIEQRRNRVGTLWPVRIPHIELKPWPFGRSQSHRSSTTETALGRFGRSQSHRSN